MRSWTTRNGIRSMALQLAGQPGQELLQENIIEAGIHDI